MTAAGESIIDSPTPPHSHVDAPPEEERERKRDKKEDSYREWTATVLAAFSAGLLGQLATYPLDTLR